MILENFLSYEIKTLISLKMDRSLYVPIFFLLSAHRGQRETREKAAYWIVADRKDEAGPP
jgi:hypothetical protein